MTMTEEKFNKAADLHKRIEHYDDMIADLNSCKFNLNPPTRYSGVNLQLPATGSFGECISISLREEDVICIKEAFMKYRDKLNTEFVML